MSTQRIPYQRAVVLRFLLTLQAVFIELPRWLLLASIAYAPWAYGCTRWWAKTLLVQGLLGVLVLWLCSLLLRRRWPRVTVPAGAVALSLLGLGWFSVSNSLASYDELLQVFSPVPQALPDWLGSWDAAFSMRAMLLVTGMTGAFFMSVDLAANPVWRRRLFLTLALSGGLLLLFGLVQRATGASGIFWEPSPWKSTFFATYFYHANAGAFINLTLPLVAGLTILAFRNNKGQFERAFWSFLLLVSITAVFVNTSRASMIIGVMIIVALTVGVTMVAARRRAKSRRLLVLATAGVLVVCALILTLSFGIEPSLMRWNQTLSSLFASEGGAPWDGRVSIYRICWLSLDAAGWFGFGPGTFAIVFPYLQREHGGELNGILRYAHQDYLQTTLEWGAIGFLLWAVLMGGGIVRTIFYLQSDPRAMTREHEMWLALCALSLIGVLIHSLVDFPLQIASLQLISAVLLGQLWVKSSTQTASGSKTDRLHAQVDIAQVTRRKRCANGLLLNRSKIHPNPHKIRE
ncbi:MAG TPA: O-antigen ligase family protein [Terrimicrobiaceae bacterium]